ncbi:NADH:flavin oxidoreductase, partial [Chloroflexota bacterium]
MSQRNRISFEKLFEPGQIGKMQLRNRLVMAPMGTSFASEDGSVSPRIRAYYEARAKGGIGLIIVECTCVERSLGQTSRLARQLLIDDDKMIPGLR